MENFAQNCRSTAVTFQRDTSGSFVILFALALIPILAIVMLAIDYSRLAAMHGELQRAADSAVRTAAAHFEDEHQAEELFAANFRANLPDVLKDTAYDLKIDQDTGTLDANIIRHLPMSFAKAFGFPGFQISVNSTGRKPVLVSKKLDSPQEVERFIRKSSEDKVKQRFIKEIKDKIKLLQKAGVKVRDIPQSEIEEIAERMAKAAKR